MCVRVANGGESGGDAHGDNDDAGDADADDGNEEDGEEECRTEDCQWCDGSGQDEGESFVTEYYQEMLDFLLEFLTDKKCVNSLEDFMINGAGYSIYKFDDKEMNVYNKVVDAVMYQVLTTNNNPNPYFKSEE